MAVGIIANPQSNATVRHRPSVSGFASSARIFFCERCKLIPLFSLIFSVLVLQGSLGFHTNFIDCNHNDCVVDDPKEQAVCFREIAITLAAQMNEQQATKACGCVRGLGPGSDYYNAQANQCYYDIAKLLAGGGGGEICNPNTPPQTYICDYIEDSSGSDILKGYGATKELCKEEVKRATIPYCYQCNVLFIFPVVLLFIIRHHIH